MLITDGDQVPEIPLGEVVANIGAGDPEHKAGIAAKFGVTFGTIFIVVVVKILLECGKLICIILIEFSIFQQKIPWGEVLQSTVRSFVIIHPHPYFCIISHLFYVFKDINI